MFHLWSVLSALRTENTECSSALVLVGNTSCRLSVKFPVTGGNCRFLSKQEENKMIKTHTEVILKLLKIPYDLHYMV